MKLLIKLLLLEMLKLLLLYDILYCKYAIKIPTQPDAHQPTLNTDTITHVPTTHPTLTYLLTANQPWTRT